MSKSRIKNTKKNFSFAFIFQLIKILLTFINRIIFVRILGATYLGINGLFNNILNVLSIADLGITTAMMYSLYKPLSTNDEKKIAAYVNFFKKVYNLIALFIFIVGIAMIPFLKYLVNLPNNVDGIYLYYILMVINTVVTYLFIYKTTLLSADQKMYIISKYDTFFQILLFILQVLILVITKNFALYIISNSLCTILSNIFKVKKTKQLYPYLNKFKDAKLNKIEKNNVFSNVKSLFLYKIGGVIQNDTDNILISIFVGTIAVGYYSNYSMIILTITSFLTTIFVSIKASLGNFINVKEKQEQLEMFKILEILNFWIVGFCSICFMILIPNFIETFFGKEYILHNSVLIFSVLNFYTSNIRQTLWMYRETTGIFNNSIKYVTIITAILNIFLSIILGKFWGLSGIICATIISRIIYAWWKEPKVIFNSYFNVSSRGYFKNYLLRLIYVIFIYFIINFICTYIIIDNLILKLIINGIITVLLSIVLLIIPYANNNVMKYVKNIVKGKN